MSAPHADRDHSEQPTDLLAALQQSIDRAREDRRAAKQSPTPSTATAGSDPTHEPCRCREEGCRGCGDDCHSAEPGTSRSVPVRASEAQVVAAHQAAWDLDDRGDHKRLSRNAARAVADAVVAAGDADEVTRLRAEVERIRNDVTLEVALDDATDRAEAAEAERDRLADVVARVEALHRTVPTGEWCGACGRNWPCPTIAALSGPTPAQTPQNGPEPALSREQGTSGQSGEGEALGCAENGEEAGR